MIQLNDILLSYGDAAIFNRISAVFSAGQRIGVVGRNGAGKSTLLKAIDSLGQGLDDGSISTARDFTIAYMPQEIVLASDKSIFDEAFSAFEDLVQLLSQKAALEKAGGDGSVLSEQYIDIQERLAHYQVADYEASVEKILLGLGFARTAFSNPVSALSVGWKMRVVLAKLLLKTADFYLFDEPTNHLDIVSKEWFAQFLSNARFGFCLVTHDRYFLERSCDYIFELERGNGTLYTGNFSAYLKQKESTASIKQASYERQQKEIARKQATIDRFRFGTRAKMAQSMLKQLDKIERIEPDPVLPTVKFNFAPPVRAGHTVLTFNDLEQSFGPVTVYKGISGQVLRGEKVAVIGPNGRGKTTLFNAIAGIHERTAGTVEFGHNVTHAIFEQDQLRALRPSNTVYQEVLDACPRVSEATVRAFLGAFLFSGDDAYKKISMLSGGERCRVALIKVLLQNANFMLLDEPTNHLDLYAKEVLLQALQQYEGTLLLVSHDHDFLQRLATRILDLTPTSLHSYPGTYESYLEQTRALQPSNNSPEQKQGGRSNRPAEKKEKGLPAHEIALLEKNITRLESKLEEVNAQFADVVYGTPQYEQTCVKREKIVKELEEASRQWQKLVDGGMSPQS